MASCGDLSNRFDVIVVGGGHAGTEAAAAAARMGARTLLATHDPERIGALSCNPSIGGIGKGHLVREIDALDGLMARAVDLAGIHFKLLNRSKGPAVQGPRAQVDRGRYRRAIQSLLFDQPGLSIVAATVSDLIVDGDGRTVTGIATEDGGRFLAGAVVLTTGTFLGGMIHIGHETTPAGRIGEAPSNALAERMRALGLRLGRLKTGTPPRLARDSIDWCALAEDPGDDTPEPFSRMTTSLDTPRVSCRTTATTRATHALIADNLALSAMYGGAISGRGPRYCPSIEDKVVRFGDRDHHQIFLEPEGLPDGPDGEVVYPNGISTSLPRHIQQEILATIPGLERAEILQPGYAVEYDFVDPRSLSLELEVQDLPGLFLAGQVNGTTGYEEAAGQGLVAGINAARCAAGGSGITFGRDSSYLGVMIDDLTTQGVSEPYRMFTSRAEFRLSLRADNADLRLTGRGVEIGCVSSERATRFRALESEISATLARARHERATDGSGRLRTVFEHLAATTPLSELDVSPSLSERSERARFHLSCEARYHGYLDRQQREIAALQSDRTVDLPPTLDYAGIGGLSNEMRERLEAARPSTFDQAQRVPGLTPTALLALLSHVRSLQTAG